MTRDELEDLIYERTRCFVYGSVADCILELIAAEREACAKVAENGLIGHTIAIAIRARGEKND